MSVIQRLSLVSSLYLARLDVYRRPFPLHWPRSYIHVVKIDNFYLLRRASISFIPQAPFPRKVLQYILSHNTLVEGRVLRWTQMTLNFQEKRSFAHHHSFALPRFRFVPCCVVEGSHSDYE